jgi:hypothetical protein
VISHLYVTHRLQCVYKGGRQRCLLWFGGDGCWYYLFQTPELDNIGNPKVLASLFDSVTGPAKSQVAAVASFLYPQNAGADAKVLKSARKTLVQNKATPRWEGKKTYTKTPGENSFSTTQIMKFARIKMLCAWRES